MNILVAGIALVFELSLVHSDSYFRQLPSLSPGIDGHPRIWRGPLTWPRLEEPGMPSIDHVRPRIWRGPLTWPRLEEPQMPAIDDVRPRIWRGPLTWPRLEEPQMPSIDYGYSRISRGPLTWPRLEEPQLRPKYLAGDDSFGPESSVPSKRLGIYKHRDKPGFQGFSPPSEPRIMHHDSPPHVPPARPAGLEALGPNRFYVRRRPRPRPPPGPGPEHTPPGRPEDISPPDNEPAVR